MKVAVIGYSGSGKSTLAIKLGEIFGAKVLHLDAVQFLPGWETRGQAEQAAIVSDFLDSNDSWIIDGNYSKLSYERRMEEADIIVELLFSRMVCLWRVVGRYFMYRDQTRPDMTEGCNEKLDREFIMWVLRDGRTKAARARYRRVASEYADKTVILRTRRQTALYLASLIK